MESGSRFQAPSCFSKAIRPSRCSGACAIKESHFWRGERRGMVLLAPTPVRARRGHPSLWPRGGKLRRARCCRGLWLVASSRVRSSRLGVKIIAGQVGAGEKALWGRYPLGVTGLEGPRPRTVPIWGVGECKLHRPKAAGAGRPGCRRPGRAPEEAGGGGGGVAAGRTRRFKQILSLGSSSPELWRSPGLSRREVGGPSPDPRRPPRAGLPPLPLRRPSAAPVPPGERSPGATVKPLAARRVAGRPRPRGPPGY